MAKIAEYYLIDASSVEKLNQKVNDRIKSGWQPFGTPTFSSRKSDYFQAVVKSKSVAEITEYYLVDASSVEKLNQEVNDRIKTGWQPFGTPTYSSSHRYYFQAVVK